MHCRARDPSLTDVSRIDTLVSRALVVIVGAYAALLAGAFVVADSEVEDSGVEDSVVALVHRRVLDAIFLIRIFMRTILVLTSRLPVCAWTVTAPAATVEPPLGQWEDMVQVM